jgi:hypothetical protein
MAKENIFGLCGLGTLGPGDLATYAAYDIKTYDINFAWKDINPAKNTYNFTDFDAKIATLVGAGKNITFRIVVSPWDDNVPAWIAAEGVPEVIVSGNTETYPYYFHAAFQTAQDALELAVANHLATFSDATKDKIFSWQICEGKTGDQGPYDGTPVVIAYRITDADWNVYKRTKRWSYFKSVNEQNKAWLKMLFNTGNDGEDLAFCNANFNNPAHKDGYLAHKYNYDGEVSQYNRQYQFQSASYLDFRSRAEAQSFQHQPAWVPKKDGFTLVWSAIAGGLDMFNLPIGQMPYVPLAAAEYFNTYGGILRNPVQSKKAAIQFADKIDYADTSRFTDDPGGPYGQLITPGLEKQYNKQIAAINANTSFSEEYKDWLRWLKLVTFINQTRCANIRTAMAATGANASEDQNDSYNNDFVIGGVKNYEKHAVMINPDATSIGGYRLGADADIFGRFERGFKIEDDAAPPMQIKLNSYLSNSARKVNAHFKVTSLDVGTGTWGIFCVKCYLKKKVFEFTNTDTGDHITHEFDTKIKLGGMIDTVADFELQYLGGDNTFFPLTEFEIL